MLARLAKFGSIAKKIEIDDKILLPGNYLHVKEFADLRIYRQHESEFETICSDLKGLQTFLQKILYISDKLPEDQRKDLQEMLDYFSDNSETLKQYGEQQPVLT